jgi:hypothetical protein
MRTAQKTKKPAANAAVKASYTTKRGAPNGTKNTLLS